MPAADFSSRPSVRPFAWLRYLWASPNTAVGLSLAGLAAVTGGRCAIVDGVLEAEGGLLVPLLRRGVPLEGGAAAVTLGHVVLGQSPSSLAQTRVHERVHVRQAEHWGPLFLPAYAAASVLALLQGGHIYRDNSFERAARREERSPAAA